MQGKSLSILTVLLVVSSVVVSGCINPTTGTNFDSGVNIINFEPEMQSVYSDESVNFQMKIKNLGSFQAEGKANLELSEWTCRGAGSASESFSLIPPYPDRGTEGEEKVFLWSCQAPKIPEGMSIPYEARVEVEYPYKTISSRTITILPTSELVALNNAGKPLPSETDSQSHSPVKAEVLVKGPIRIRDGGSVEFPITIKISNIGGGIVKDSKVNLKVEKAGAISNLKDCDQSNLPLWKGQSQTVTCEVTANNVKDITTSRILANVEYTYIISSSANVAVLGSK